jgi:outer membrane lipoprotein-sorting protein
MKIFLTILILVLATLAIGQSEMAPPSQSIPVDQENVQKAKAVLDQTIQALGGQAYLNIQDISQEGRTYSFYHGRPNSVGVVFWRFYRFPDKDRIELTKQRDVVYVYNGDKGYEVTYKGSRPQDPKDLTDYLRRRHYSLDWVLRKWLNEPGVALFYEGQTVTEGKTVEQVTVMNAHNEGVTLYLDTSDHLPVKKTFSWRDPADQQRNVEEEVFDNYRVIQGIPTPYTVTRTFNGDMSNQRFTTSVTYNQGISDSQFSPDTPAGQKKP